MIGLKPYKERLFIMFAAVGALIAIFILWKLFVEGLLFKIILFCFGWVGIYICLNAYVDGAKQTAITIGTNTHISWAAVVPTIICLLALACSRSER